MHQFIAFFFFVHMLKDWSANVPLAHILKFYLDFEENGS